ncbi:unnamed protein product [Victoria cruziana]
MKDTDLQEMKSSAGFLEVQKDIEVSCTLKRVIYCQLIPDVDDYGRSEFQWHLRIDAKIMENNQNFAVQTGLQNLELLEEHGLLCRVVVGSIKERAQERSLSFGGS